MDGTVSGRVVGRYRTLWVRRSSLPGRQWATQESNFWSGSVLGDLRKLCKELAKAHPWNVDEGTWFVLTGEAPMVLPISTKPNSSSVLGRTYNTISLRAVP
jgi:hypothetical protein